MDEVDAIIETASRIQSNAKIKALKTAIQTAFEYQGKQNIPQRLLYSRNQSELKSTLPLSCARRIEEDDILLFNGDFNDA